MKPAATNRRIGLLAAAFLVLLAATLARAVWIQVVKGPEYAAMALRQHRETVVVPAARGTIVDRTGEPLAIGKLATTVYANPRQVDDARDLTLGGREVPRLGSGRPLPDARRPFARLRLRRAQGRPAKGGEAREARTSPGSASIPRSFASTRRGPSRRRCSATQASTTRASRVSSARSRGRSPASPGSQTIVKDPFGRALDVVETKPETPGQERSAHDRPPDPGERRGGPPGDRAPLERDGRRRRSSWIRTRARSSRWRPRRASTPTGSRRPAPIVAATAPSPTRTSPARRSSS